MRLGRRALTGLRHGWFVLVAAAVVAAAGTGVGWRLSHQGTTTAGLPAVAAHASTPSPVPSRPPAPLVIAAPAQTPVPADTERTLPVYSTVFSLDIPAVGIHLPVVSVGLKDGAMDAPFGPLSSPVWHEAFWLNLTAEPGQPGTLTLAGHLDDTAGRPGAFWTVRQVVAGDIVSLTSKVDGTVARYRITDVHAYTDSQSNSAAVLARLYGSVGGGKDDGVARIALVTCTGRFVNGEYDHRFLAFGELVPPNAPA